MYPDALKGRDEVAAVDGEHRTGDVAARRRAEEEERQVESLELAQEALGGARDHRLTGIAGEGGSGEIGGIGDCHRLEPHSTSFAVQVDAGRRSRTLSEIDKEVDHRKNPEEGGGVVWIIVRVALCRNLHLVNVIELAALA